MSVSGNRTAAQMCDHDGKPCYVGLGTDDAHWRCGTSACANPIHRATPTPVGGLDLGKLRAIAERAVSRPQPFTPEYSDMSSAWDEFHAQFTAHKFLALLDHLAKVETARDAALARVGELEARLERIADAERGMLSGELREGCVFHDVSTIKGVERWEVDDVATEALLTRAADFLDALPGRGQGGMGSSRDHAQTLGSALERQSLSIATSMLRQAYAHLHAESVVKQRELADGLIAPAIRQLEAISSAKQVDGQVPGMTPNPSPAPPPPGGDKP